MVWKSVVFTFCLLKSWSCGQNECANIFYSKTQLKRKSEIKMKLSDLYDSLHTVLRFYKNNYTVLTTVKSI